MLTGAKGVNLWSSFRVPPPQRSARLYRALVERGLASAVSGSLMPTDEPFLYTLSATATDGTPLDAVDSGAARRARSRQAAAASPTPSSRKAKAQLRARLVFDNDSVTNIAHQLGYFETIASVGSVLHRCRRASRPSRVDDVAAAARRGLSAIQPHGRLVRCRCLSATERPTRKLKRETCE